MEHKYFKAICSSRDFRYLLLESAYIGQREMEGLPVLLFQIGQHYVELVFNRVGTEVLASKEFTDVDELEPYLIQIEVPRF